MKTNFLNKLKQGLFLLIAALGTFISYAQPTTTTTIGGSKTPDIGGFNDIGGKGGTEPILITILPLTTQCTFAYFDETGGRNGTGTSTDTGHVDYPDDFDFFDIGGRSTGGELSALDTGGKNSTGGLENTCTICPDTGGSNGGKSTTGELVTLETGGSGSSDTDTGQIAIYEIGGRNTNSTGELANLDTGGRGNELGGGCVFDTGGRDGKGTSTGGDFTISEDIITSDWSIDSGCVLRPVFSTE